MGETCSNCRFGVYQARRTYVGTNLVSRPAEVLCRRYPNFLSKSPDDWCGEYQPAQQEGEGE